MTLGNIQTMCWSERIKFGKHFRVAIPSGLISEAGQKVIVDYLYEHTNLPCPCHSIWDWHAQVKGKGEYVGSFAKRVAKYYYQMYRIKLNSNLLGAIGSMVSQYTVKHNKYIFDFTNCFNWDAGDFGDYESCFWTCRREAKPKLEQHGVFAIRFFKTTINDHLNGRARAWIHRTEKYLIAFNSYGEELSSVARILAHWLGVSYRKIRLSNNGSDHGLIWINGGHGYIIGPESEINGINEIDLHIESDVACCRCLELFDGICPRYMMSTGPMCKACFAECFTICNWCDEVYGIGDLHKVFFWNAGVRRVERFVCEDCRNEHFIQCDNCKEWCSSEFMVTIDGREICDECRAR